MSFIRLCPLKSSSKGNSTVVFDGSTKILVDCGISGKILEQCLENAGIRAESLDAILITHEHTDHIKGVGVVSRKYNLPIYANAATWQAMEGQLGNIKSENKRVFETGADFYINDIAVKSFHTSHDAAESVGYTFEKNGKKVAVATDMGMVTDEVLSAILGSDAVLIEANYDLNMLEIGAYPYDLKRRIKGDLGHLCNDATGALAQLLAESGTCEIILGHLSEENNFPMLALKTVENFIFENCDNRRCHLSVMTREGQRLSGVGKQEPMSISQGGLQGNC